MDRISKKHRSWNMSRIKGRDTKPELIVRSMLHRMGYRFRVNVKTLPGKPDIVLPKYKTVIFVHGCFWHRHKGCKYAYTPKSRQEFWQVKFAANQERHDTVVAELQSKGFAVVTIWECATRRPGKITKKLSRMLSEPYRSRRTKV